EPSKDAFIGLM
nr:eledoisin [Eledone moschata]